MSDMTDVIAGRFALCDPIARGGSGVVWRAYDRKAQQFCAAKVLRRRDAGDLLRFVREQSVRMSHEHVLTPYSWAAEDAHVVIASELVDGGSVSTLLGDHGPLAEGTVAAVLDQLLIALEQVHAAGLVHRDVKPANLLLRATGTGTLQVLLSDFGLAIGADDAHLTQHGTVVGTPGYLAPEILRGGVTPDPCHDLYAAGRVASALAAGVEPAQVGVPTDLSGFGPGPLRDAVATLSALDARTRPRTAAEARVLLRSVPVDPVPRTRAGTAIEVRHRLPALSDAAVTEAGGHHTMPLGTGDATAPVVVGTGHGTGNGHGTVPLRSRPARRRRGALLVGAGLVVAAAVAVPVALSVAGGDDRTDPTRPPTSTPTRTTGGTYVPPAVTAGQVCSFTDEGDVRKAPGPDVRCTRRSDGSYVWEKA